MNQGEAFCFWFNYVMVLFTVTKTPKEREKQDGYPFLHNGLVSACLLPERYDIYRKKKPYVVSGIFNAPTLQNLALNGGKPLFYVISGKSITGKVK